MNSIAIALTCLILATVIFLVIAIQLYKSNNYSEYPVGFVQFSILTGIITFMVMCVSFTYPLEPSGVETVVLDNDKNIPVKFSYLQYHMYTEPSLESVVLMPGQIKVVNHAKVIKTVKFDYTTDSL